jgi:hypothetical protein
MERTNILHEFFNSKSDANELLTAGDQEGLESKFQQFMTNDGECHAMDFVNEMCLESLSPEQFEKWEEIKLALKGKRLSLKKVNYAV